ncbi:MAG: phosphoglycolate phosphatase [Gammaproteobacteria bacterium]
MLTISRTLYIPVNNRLRTVLFDLDGTLADTAPDLAYALNTLLEEEGHPRLTLSKIRPVVSQGSPGLLYLGFALRCEDAAYASLRQRLLDIYSNNLVRETRLFPGMTELLSALEQRGMNWGIVTNKPAFLTNPLVEQLGLAKRAACVVSGDTTAHAKPHPASLLYACEQAGSDVQQCIYIGDARCDIEAGKSAGMTTMAAVYGYIPALEMPHDWSADGMVNHPDEILAWINDYEITHRRTAVS